MRFIVNNDLLVQSRTALFRRNRLYWIVGGAGSGKTTICRALSARFDIPVYDMDAHIYGAYHGRFTQERHPVNRAWSTARDGLAWLLEMSWDEFDRFNQAALPEYLDLLVEDLDTTKVNASVLIDGGICNPALVAQVISIRQIVCLAIRERSSAEIWEETDERNSMKEVIYQLDKPEEAWRRFLEFDDRITHTIVKECQENNISVCWRGEGESVDEFAGRVADVLGIR
jgi:replication-associated recombination protein RarA